MKSYKHIIDLIKSELNIKVEDKAELEYFLNKGIIKGKYFEYSLDEVKVSIIMALHNLDENRLHYNNNDYYFGKTEQGYIFYKYYDENSEIVNPNFEDFLDSIEIEGSNIFEILNKNYEFYIHGD